MITKVISEKIIKAAILVISGYITNYYIKIKCPSFGGNYFNIF